MKINFQRRRTFNLYLLLLILLFAQIAQLVEQRTENPRVTGSIPVLGTKKTTSQRSGFFIQFFSDDLSEEDLMISFASDYVAGAHPEVLKRLIETNMDILTGYGTDTYTLSAAEKIKKACNCPDAEVFLISGGTQTNQLVISTMLQPYEGVISASTGHINVHEAGAVEYTGHKVLSIPSHDGKVVSGELKDYIKAFYSDDSHTHMVFPGMLYVSFPTEYGTIYSKQELTDIYNVCREYDISLFIDGARLGYGLASKKCDITLPELAKLCDVFYIGGTKVGALCGEAVVFTGKAPKHFETQIKQHGALLAKGRLNGVQFDALFTDDLYMKISKHAIEMADKLFSLFRERGYEFFLDSPTNQQFVILNNKKLKDLEGKVGFSLWEPYDGEHTVVRFATSWSTTDDEIEELKKLL